MNQGQCLCGAIRYRTQGPYPWMIYCHCSMCRKHHGTLFGTDVGIAKENFQWLRGEESIVHFRASSAFERPFCKHCGSAVPDVSADPVVCPAGTLAGELGTRPGAHIFVKSKSPLYDINDGVKQFDEYPSDFGVAMPESLPAAGRDNRLRGGCLCGDVAFELEDRPTRLVHCHCSRCRRSRGGAYASNVFVTQDKLRWTRGAERVHTYKLPEAKEFFTAFCERCGSLLPESIDAIGMYLIPVGVFDTAPPIASRVHIYVGSKAPWVAIGDAAPQFDRMPPRERVAELMFDRPT